MPETIYVLTNEAMPGLVKIGITNDEITSRVANLSSATGVPLPFECFFAAEVEDASSLERKLHQLFSEHRLNPRREFFRIEPERVILAISIGPFKDVTPSAVVVDSEEQKALTKVKDRRPKIRLEAIGINKGDTLTFFNDENVVAQVADGGKVLYGGEILSLSAAALKVLQAQGYRTTSASGSEYWMFQGELLDERRRRLESLQFDEAFAPTA